MTPEREKEISFIIDYLLAGAVMDNARYSVLRRAVEELARKAGVDSLDGVPLAQWFSAQHEEEMKKKLFSLEDLTPEGAAALQTTLNRIFSDAEKMRKPNK